MTTPPGVDLEVLGSQFEVLGSQFSHRLFSQVLSLGFFEVAYPGYAELPTLWPAAVCAAGIDTRAASCRGTADR